MVAVAVGLSCSGGMVCLPCHLQKPWNLLNIPQPTFKDLLKPILLRNRPKTHLVALAM